MICDSCATARRSKETEMSVNKSRKSCHAAEIHHSDAELSETGINP